VAESLDAAVAAFHARPLRGRYKALMLDGVVLARFREVRRRTRPMGVSFRTEPQWTAFSSPSSPTKTKCRESQPFSN
jgi:hypothetical protein